jgi:hypothetical protein
MDVYILDALLRPIDVVDEYESFIWTERYAVKGDFELVILATPANRNRFVEDTMLVIADSNRVMRVKTVSDTVDVEKGATLTIKGFELSSIFEERVSASKEDGGTHDGMLKAVTYFNGWTPLDLMLTMVWRICIAASGWQINTGDTIPFLQDPYAAPGSLYPADTIPHPSTPMLWEQKAASLYSALTDVAQAYDVGFRLYKDPNSSKLYFESYTGIDRTSAQTVHPPVVFSSDMENLQNTTDYKDNTQHYNVVIAMYVYKNEEVGGYPPDLTISETVSDLELAFSSGGFDQKTKIITITQLPDSMELVDAPAYLQQLATEELTRSRPTNVYDGEVDQNAEFVYGRDYNLGDLVEVRGDDGGAAFMRVEEQIFKYDGNGKSSYPSLVTKESINPGTWRSWKYDVNWIDIGSGEYWNNQ